uniref:Uncharacterized protein n=1 Tax=Davidia involucrata TaxID=16924 RepID=A0A5B7BT39_DAVIN
MDSGTSLLSMESTAATRTMSRSRPLHTCGLSILVIVHRAYTIAQELNGPVGSMAKRIATFTASASPIIYAMQYQWLAVLSFVDDHILAVENMVETLFPPSAHLFNKIDELVHTAETLPGKVDDAVNKFPMIIHQFPFLDWALVHVISWLKFFISTLTHWGSNNTREKEIMIDINCNNVNNESESAAYNAHCPVESPIPAQCENVEKKSSSISDSSQDETKSTVGATVKPDTMKCSYKEVLEKGTKENSEKKKDSAGSSMEEIPKAIVSEEEACREGKKKNGNKSIEGAVMEDPILELFEASWNMKPGKGGKGSSLPRSFSYM